MTKTEAKRAFMAKEIQIYVDVPNFSLLRGIVFKHESSHPFKEEECLNMYCLRQRDSFYRSANAFAEDGKEYPIVNLSDITEDKKIDLAGIETKHLRFTVKLKGSNLCIEKTTDGFSTMELLAACVLLENELAKEKEELMSGGQREEVTNN